MDMKETNMQDWGLTERFSALAATYPALSVGRVLSQQKGLYRVVCAQGEQSAAVSGRFRYGAATVSDYPAVGDFVMLMPAESGDCAPIHAVLPRKSVFVRKSAGTSNSEQVVAANVDVAFLCMALNNDFNLRRLERYLSVAWDSGATPVVVLTKADLCADTESMRASAEAAAVGTTVLVTSSLESDGCAAVLPYIGQGQTVAFIGSSGVGKSTLINRLLGEERLATNGLRNDDKGRHTTTHRELIALPQGGMVIDTPGMRELGMWDAAEGLERTFRDIEELSLACRFHDCTHQTEPGCAVRAAVENGALTPQRLQSYRKLKAENAYAAHAESYLAAKERKFQAIAKTNKVNKKR